MTDCHYNDGDSDDHDDNDDHDDDDVEGWLVDMDEGRGDQW